MGTQRKDLYQRALSHGGGPIPYDVLGMCKRMLLVQWHALSDPQPGQALRVRIDFMGLAALSPARVICLMSLSAHPQ